MNLDEILRGATLRAPGNGGRVRRIPVGNGVRKPRRTVKQVKTVAGVRRYSFPLMTKSQQRLTGLASRYLSSFLKPAPRPQPTGPREWTSSQGELRRKQLFLNSHSSPILGGIKDRDPRFGHWERQFTDTLPGAQGTGGYAPWGGVAGAYGGGYYGQTTPYGLGEGIESLRAFVRGDLPLGVQNRVNIISEMLARPMERQFQEVTLPRTREAFAGGGGYWGGARAKAEQNAAAQHAEALAAMRAKVLARGEDVYGRNLLEALKLGPSAYGFDNPQQSFMMDLLARVPGVAGLRTFENVIQPIQNRYERYLTPEQAMRYWR